ADDKAAVRALVSQAIKAHGGEAVLAKFAAATMKMKGTVHVQGMAIEFTGELSAQGMDQQKAVIDFEIGGQKFTIKNGLNRDKGWVKLNDTVVEMDKEELANTREEAYAGWLQSLLPLKDEAFALAPLGEVMVDERPAVGIRVSHKDHKDVNLYFDKKTN